MRDIAGMAGMLPGLSVLPLRVEGRAAGRRVRRGRAAHQGSRPPALAQDADPWTRLENVCAAHLEGLLEDSDYGQVVIRVRPDDAPDVAARLMALRDEYEQTFAQALSDLPLPPRTDRRALKLMLLGALNWSQTWYRSGKDSPQVLARRFVRLLRDPLET